MLFRSCRTILSELDKDAQTDQPARDVAMPASQMIQALLDPKLAELGSRVRFKAGPLDDSPEPMAKPIPDLKYALEILLDNANDFAVKQITFTTSWSQKAIAIEICDDGPGFTPLVLSRVGQPWNSSREGREGHKGLGLFLAITLIEALEGEVKIVNAPAGGGAQISIHMSQGSLL